MATFQIKLLLKFDSIPEADWKVHTNGLSCKGKEYTILMIHIATYYDQKFALSQYGCLLRVKAGRHNVKIAMNKLVHLRIMKESHDNQGSTLYGLVDTLCIHIQCDEDDSLEDDLDRLFTEGNTVIKKKVSRGVKEKTQATAARRESNQSKVPLMIHRIPTRETLRAMKLTTIRTA